MDALKPKLKVVGLDPGQEMIAKGELELGLMNASEVRSFVKFAGPVPAPLQDYTNYEAALTATASPEGPARALLPDNRKLRRALERSQNGAAGNSSLKVDYSGSRLN